jgi:hypothetical protein
LSVTSCAKALVAKRAAKVAPASAATLDFLVNIVFSLIDAVALLCPSAVVCGLSLGGTVAVI